MKQIPISKPYFDKKEAKELIDTLQSGWVMQGPKVEMFEREFARYTGSKYAIATSSGTTALHLALEASGVGNNDEVITTAFSFIATANSILYCGAHPVFCDIDLKTYNLDPQKVHSFIEKDCSWNKRRKILLNKKTNRLIKAIMPVDQVGLPSDLDAIKKIARKYNLFVIEDAACALGAKYKGKKIGSIADVSCFSFHPRKIITTAEGGMIATDNKRIRELVTALRSHGQSSKERFDYRGYNYRMSDLHASLGLAQMKKLDSIVSKRRSLAKRYDKGFKNIKLLDIPYIPEYATANYQSYTLMVRKEDKFYRDRIVEQLVNLGISVKKGITAIHREPYYKKLLGNISLPFTELANDSTFLLPLYPSLTGKEESYIIKSVEDVCRKY